MPRKRSVGARSSPADVFLRMPSKPVVKARPRTIRFMFWDRAVMVVLRRGKTSTNGTDSRSVILTEPGSVDKKKIACDCSHFWFRLNCRGISETATQRKVLRSVRTKPSGGVAGQRCEYV